MISKRFTYYCRTSGRASARSISSSVPGNSHWKASGKARALGS